MKSMATESWLYTVIESFLKKEIHRQQSGGISGSYQNIGNRSDVEVVAGELFSRSVVVGLGRGCSWLYRILSSRAPVAGLSESTTSRACGGRSRESGFFLPQPCCTFPGWLAIGRDCKTPGWPAGSFGSDSNRN